MQKKIAIAVAIVAMLGVGVFVFVAFRQGAPEQVPQPEEAKQVFQRQVIGASVEGRNIESYTFGNGSTHVAFVGGVHGGYEWNTVLLAEMFIDYLQEHPDIIPANLRVSVIPNANPDGVQKGIGTAEARFNANGVDLNRNFDCKWQAESTWRSQAVSAGSAPFSEPETQAIRDFVLQQEPDAVVFWHSQANEVYASECEEGILPETLAITRAYAGAADYRPVEKFDAYEVTGDAEGWLASLGVPAITVELETHESIEWERNLRGIEEVLEYYAE